MANVCLSLGGGHVFVTSSVRSAIDDCKTYQWLRSTRLKAETEGLINAAQDQNLPTKSHFARICEGYDT